MKYTVNDLNIAIIDQCLKAAALAMQHFDPNGYETIRDSIELEQLKILAIMEEQQ
jgi:hypothetical protein